MEICSIMQMVVCVGPYGIFHFLFFALIFLGKNDLLGIEFCCYLRSRFFNILFFSIILILYHFQKIKEMEKRQQQPSILTLDGHKVRCYGVRWEWKGLRRIRRNLSMLKKKNEQCQKFFIISHMLSVAAAPAAVCSAVNIAQSIHPAHDYLRSCG